MRFVLAALALGLACSAHARYGVRGDDPSYLEGRFELGPRLTHLTLTDPSTEASLPMGGIGIYARYRLSRRVGMEGTFDVVAADELGQLSVGEVVRVTAPFAVSVLWYFFPESRWQLYLLAGVGVADHEINYKALDQRLTYTTPLFQCGLGLQYRADTVRFDLSLRSLLMEEQSEDMKLETTGPGDGSAGYSPRLGDRELQGAMVNLGVNWGW